MDYIFRPAEINEIEEIFSLYVQRIRWMDEHGIRQWNVTDYMGRYPVSYYQKQCELGALYVLRSVKDNALAGAVVLYQKDIRWHDKPDMPAYYVHNLVSAPGCKGAGARMIAEVERIAVAHGKLYMRLDCAVDNAFLNRYYEAKGYKEAGICEDRLYRGICREKKLPTT